MRRIRIATLGGVAVAAAVSVYLGILATREPVGYDSFWHVFIARQETWRSFWREVQDNAHPPLFYLLLKAAIALRGPSLLAYRLWSILGIAVSTVLLAQLTCRLTRNAALGIAAAAAFGFSASAAEVGLEVRSYAIFLAFAIAAACAYVEWLAARPGHASPWARVLFAGALSGAILSHYSAFFLLGATFAAPAILWVLHPRWRVRLRREATDHPIALAAMFGAPLAAAFAAWAVHLRHYVNGIDHVAGFIFDRHAESRLAFVLRNTRNLVLLFLPDLKLSEVPAAILAAVLIGGLCFVMARRAARARLAVAPFALLLPMVAANLLAGLRGRYPFGGYVRHEVFLFPFLLLALFVGLDVARRMLPARLKSRSAFTGLAGLLVALNGWHAVATFPSSSEGLGQANLNRFEAHFGTPPAILVDQYNFIILFGHFHEWRWRLRWEDPPAALWQIWDVSRGGERFAVCRQRMWQSDFTKEDVYLDIRSCLSRTGADRVAVFRPQQFGVNPDWPIADAPALAREHAPAAGLEPLAVFVEGTDIYTAFRRRDSR
jgi:4-amino-4-deoxy-L-arabinose transferase-like glycosyltransferase